MTWCYMWLYVTWCYMWFLQYHLNNIHKDIDSYKDKRKGNRIYRVPYRPLYNLFELYQGGYKGFIIFKIFKI